MSLVACGEANDTELATTRTGRAKKCRIKAGDRFSAPANEHRPALHPQARFGGQPPATRAALRPEMSGSGISHRWSEFSLFAVTGGRYQKIQRENRRVPPSHKVAVTGGFLAFHKNQRGGHFHPLGASRGVSFSSALTAAAILQRGGLLPLPPVKFCVAKQRIKVLEKNQ